MVSSERLPSEDGIVPVNWLLSRLSSITRPLASVVTPYHSTIGALLSQFLLSVQLAPPVVLYNATSAARSVVGEDAPVCTGTGPAVP